ncbi:MAG: penicillin-binding protein 2 [Lachnospiraceae bacterium]|nr:penicillin-binding protein 2 [Lachnospiraceae bacterium]
MKKVRKKKQPVKFTRGMSRRLLFIFGVVVIGLVILCGRLIYIHANEGDDYTIKVLEQQNYSSKTIPYKRGDIVDRNGVVLATSIKVYNLILDPKIILSDDGKYVDATLEALNVCFGYDIAELNSLINENSTRSYYVYKKKLTYEEIQQFLEMQQDTENYPNIQGVWFESEYERKYPFSSLACNIIGFTSSGNVGTWGIEEYYDEYLDGVDGREYGYVNNDNIMEQVKKAPENGNSIVSTIDFNIQTIVEKWIAYYRELYTPENLGVIIMDPNSGEILAMAGQNTYDLNNPRDLSAYYTEEELAAMTDEETLDALNKIWRNYCISDSYEPGSTAKPFTVAAALEEGNVASNSKLLCDGKEFVGGWTIKCHKKSGHGEISLQQAIAYSCNDAMMQLGVLQGVETFVDYQNRFSFGTKTGVDLPGEASCETLIKDESMGASDLATNTFGQNFNTTMIQLATAFSASINGGYYYQPHVVKQILNDNGGVVESFDKKLVKQVVTKETSDILKEGLRMCVESGTGTKVAIDGYTISGKTGTAEKYPRGNGEYLLSFIGFAPYDNPEVVCYVILDNPVVEGSQSTGQVLEIWKNIMTEVLPYMDIFEEDQIVNNESQDENIESSVFEDENIDEMNQQAGVSASEGENSNEGNSNGDTSNGDTARENSGEGNNAGASQGQEGSGQESENP